MKKPKYVLKPWHDSNLKITKNGLLQMRVLIIVGVIMGFLLGISI